jgi:hypothetical protein
MVGPWQKETLAAGFVGTAADGKRHANSAGTAVSPGDKQWATSTTFKPQLTSFFNHPSGPGFKHVHVPPGEYVVYVRRGEVVADWKKVTLKAGGQAAVDLTVDPAKTGVVVLSVPEEEAKAAGSLALTPAEFDPSDAWFRSAFQAARLKAGEKAVTVRGVPAGKYHALLGKSEAEVEVTAGKTTAVTLVRAKAKG